MTEIIKRPQPRSTEPPADAQLNLSRPLKSPLSERLGPELKGSKSKSSELMRLNSELSGYKIISRLGRGGFGAVYAARDLALDRDVAIKVFTRDSDPTAASRFKDEGRLLAKLHHPHIVQVYQMGSMSDGAAFLVMERFGSGSIKEHWPRGVCPPLEESVRIIKQLLSALSAAHQIGVVHRDIKEANILYDAEQGQIKLCDFGIARALERLADQAKTTRDGVIIGTEHYIAPERYQGRNHDTRSDLYSVGVIFYRLLTGHRPLERHPGESLSPQMLIYRLFSEPIDGLDAIPERVAHVCKRLLEIDTTRRYQEASVAARELERALDQMTEVITESMTGDITGSTTEITTEITTESPLHQTPPVRILAPPIVDLDRAAQTQTARGLDAQVTDASQAQTGALSSYIRPLTFMMIGVILMMCWTWYTRTAEHQQGQPQDKSQRGDAVILRPVRAPSISATSIDTEYVEVGEVAERTPGESVDESVNGSMSERSKNARATRPLGVASREVQSKRSSVTRDSSEEKRRQQRTRRKRRRTPAGSTSRSNDESSPFIYPHSK